MSKVDYVRAEARKPAGGHHCHWPDCDKAVPPAMWGCRHHWFKLPLRLRARIWTTYVPGQEITKTPSAEYLAVAREVQEWIALAAGAQSAETNEDLAQSEGRQSGPPQAGNAQTPPSPSPSSGHKA